MRKWGHSLPSSAFSWMEMVDERINGGSISGQGCTNCGKFINSIDWTAFICSVSVPGEVSRCHRKPCPDRKCPEAQWIMEHRVKHSKVKVHLGTVELAVGKNVPFCLESFPLLIGHCVPQELQQIQAAVTLIQFRSMFLHLRWSACLHMALKVIFLVLTESQRQGKCLP